MRGAPQNGFSRLICLTKVRIPLDTARRPARRRDLQRQNRQKPPRCQRTSLSGLKMNAALSRDGNSRYSQTKTSLSVFLSLSLAGAALCAVRRRNPPDFLVAARLHVGGWLDQTTGVDRAFKFVKGFEREFRKALNGHFSNASLPPRSPPPSRTPPALRPRPPPSSRSIGRRGRDAK
jgi:hypothetical protein